MDRTEKTTLAVALLIAGGAAAAARAWLHANALQSFTLGAQAFAVVFLVLATYEILRRGR